MKIDQIKKKYIDAYRLYGGSDRKSLLWTKDKQDMRFQILLGEKYKKSHMRLLDYGCGFADLYLFMKKHFYNIEYHGCDINEDFVIESKKRYKSQDIFLINNIDDIKNKYDIVLISGTFNVLFPSTIEEKENYVFDSLSKLFEKTNHLLTVNFLSHLTDAEYKYEDHFYLDPVKLYDYAIKNMTKRVQIDTASMPYEITFKFFKNEDLDKEMTIYKD